MVQPIITRADDGSEPANCRIQEAMIDALYSSAGVDFYFLEPIVWDNTTMRDGKVGVDQVVKAATKQEIYRGNKRVSNVIFTNRINGRPGPAGLAREPGWHTFISMVDAKQAHSDAQDAFVVAHECGHNLGLTHAVDDSKVPNDVPNVMGDGPFAKRVAPAGINDYQIKIIRDSPLSVAKARCLAPKAARRLIVDETFEPYFAQLQPREIETLTGKSVQRNDLDAARNTARERFQSQVKAFTEEETEALIKMARQIDGLIGDDMPLFSDLPWAFIKINDQLCGGFAHTRSECIFFSERTVATIAQIYHKQGIDAALKRFGPLMVHEQLHVLQRMHPKRFANLYQDVWGFIQAEVQGHPTLIANQITNPDGVRCEWVIPIKQPDSTTRYFWPRTLLRETEGIAQMGRDFEAWMVEVVPAGKNAYRPRTDDAGQLVKAPLNDHADYLARFPIRSGHDHPNEIAAYLFTQLFLTDYLPASKDQPIDPVMDRALAPLRKWCTQQLDGIQKP